jgi:hypothetical protein
MFIVLELYYYERPKYERTILGHVPLVCPIGAYFGLTQLTFMFVYGVMRGMFPWWDLNAELWIMPEVTIPLYLFYIWAIGSFIVGIIGAWIVYHYGSMDG